MEAEEGSKLLTEGALDPELVQHIFSFLVFKDPNSSLQITWCKTQNKIHEHQLAILRSVCQYWNRLCAPFIRHGRVPEIFGTDGDKVMERLRFCEKRAEEGQLYCLLLRRNFKECLPALVGSKSLATSLQKLRISMPDTLKLPLDVFSLMCREFRALESLKLHCTQPEEQLRCLFADPSSNVATTLTSLSLSLPKYMHTPILPSHNIDAYSMQHEQPQHRVITNGERYLGPTRCTKASIPWSLLLHKVSSWLLAIFHSS